MYVKITNIDIETKLLCTESMMASGPSLPDIKGFKLVFSKESNYPIKTNLDGTYCSMPEYFGICDDDADINITGVLDVLSKEQFDIEKQTELDARKPYESWVSDIDTMLWNPPVPYPKDMTNLYWDEQSISWKEYPAIEQLQDEKNSEVETIDINVQNLPNIMRLIS